MRSDSTTAEQYRAQRGALEENIALLWRAPLERLEAFMVLARQAGEALNDEVRADTLLQQDYVFEVLTRLHARACLIASEILALLRTGHADGAHARWRSLHEIAVVGEFIRQMGAATAERYLLHDTIESYKAAREYQEDCAALGYAPLPAEEFNKIETTYQSLLKRFGPAFKHNYGWASAALGKEKPTFREIEETVGLDHLRPFYKLASHNVHANAKGLFFRLGLYPGQDMPLSGPTNTGLAEPGHGTAISLGKIIASLLSIRPTPHRQALGDTLLKRAEEIGEVFQQTQRSLEEN